MKKGTRGAEELVLDCEGGLGRRLETDCCSYLDESTSTLNESTRRDVFLEHSEFTQVSQYSILYSSLFFKSDIQDVFIDKPNNINKCKFLS